MSKPKRRKLDHNFFCNSLFYPVLSDKLTEQIELIDVYVDTISDPKFISKIITDLNASLPLPELSHLKRVKGRDVLIGICDKIHPISVEDFIKGKIDTYLLENNIKKVSVAKFPPITRAQYEDVHKLWPCNFHSNKYIENLYANTLFNNEEIKQHELFMKMAINVSKYSNCSDRVGVIIVDPNLNSVVAVGYDKRNDNPILHAVMNAIDNVALTQLLSGNESLIQNIDQDVVDFDMRGIPATILEELKKLYSGIKFGALKFKNKDEIVSPNDGPYLCTNYTVYSTCEPCIMCSMALIHSRAKRVFYGRTNKLGGLGTLCKIHTIQDLNHHYEVFAGLLKDECILK